MTTRKVRGGELFWGGVAPSRGFVGALLSRSQSFSGVLRCSLSFPIVSRSRLFTPFYKCNDAKSSTFCIITFIKTAPF